MMKRIFSAIEIPADAKARVESHIDNLRKSIPVQGVRWVSPEKMHLTLRFIGKASPEDVERMIGAHTAVAGSTEPFDIGIEGTGVFPDPRFARVLWLGLSDAAPVMDLKTRLDDALCSSGMPPESRPFRPHLTIARFRSTKPGLGPLVSGHLEKGFGPVGLRVSRIVLFESSLRPAGPVYSVLHSAEFSG